MVRGRLFAGRLVEFRVDDFDLILDGTLSGLARIGKNFQRFDIGSGKLSFAQLYQEFLPGLGVDFDSVSRYRTILILVANNLGIGRAK